MKKLIAIVMMLLPMLAWGQEIKQTERAYSETVKELIKSFKMYEYENNYYSEDFDVCGLPLKNGDYALWIFVQSPDIAFFQINAKNVDKLRNALKLAKDKFCEWDSVARVNNVRDFSKDLEIKFPKQLLCWFVNNRPYGQKNVPVKFVFKVDDNGNTNIISSFSVGSAKNRFVSTEYSLAFSSPMDIQTLIDALDEDKIKSGLSKVSERLQTVIKTSVENSSLFQ